MSSLVITVYKKSNNLKNQTILKHKTSLLYTAAKCWILYNISETDLISQDSVLCGTQLLWLVHTEN